jgi:lipopolysaccharide export system protein LptA
MRTRSILLAAAIAALPAWAERADREKEIVVQANGSTLDDVKRNVVFDGDVVITQGTMRMTANKVTVREDPQRHKFYVAVGNPVTFREKRDNVDEYVEGYAQRAEFDDLNNLLHLYDKARVKSNQNEITGDYIIPPKKGADAKAGDAKAATPPAQPGIRLKPDTSSNP